MESHMIGKPHDYKDLSLVPIGIHPKINPKIALAGFRFIKIRPVSKRAHESEWNTKNNYLADDPSILHWLHHPHSFEVHEVHYEGYGNYGILCDEDHIVVDLDTPEIIATYLEAQDGFDPLPKTMIVQSGSGKGMHLIYTTSGSHTVKMDDPVTKQNVGHIKSVGGYAVGPTSIHDKTKKPYIVLEDNDVAFVEFGKLLAVFNKYIQKREIPVQESPRLDRAKYDKFSIDIPIANVTYPEKPQDKGSGEIQGTHPVHGSSGGNNFSINTHKNTWHCYRCNSGGGPLEWLAVEHDIIRCDESKKGILRGDKFLEVLEIAKRLGYEIEMPKRKAVEKPRILENEPLVLESLPEELPDAHITLVDAFPRLGKTHWAILQAIKYATANIVSNTHSINEQQLRIFRNHRRVGQFAVHLEGKTRSCRNAKNPCRCKHGCDLYPYGGEGDYMAFDAEARDLLYEREILTNEEVPEDMCPYWAIKAAEKVAHFCFTVAPNLSMISDRSITIIDEDPTVSYFYPSSTDLAENIVSAHSASMKCPIIEKWDGIEDYKKYLTGNKRPKGKKTLLRIIEILEQIREILILTKEDIDHFNKTTILEALNSIDTFIPAPEDIDKITLLDNIKRHEKYPDSLSVFAEALLFPYIKKQFAWQGHHPSTLRLIANEEIRIRDPPQGKMILIGSTRAEIFAKSTGKETQIIRVKTFPFSENFLFIVVKPSERESYMNGLEKTIRMASRVNENYRYPSLILVGTEQQQGRLLYCLGGIAKGSKEENRIGQQWNRKAGVMNIFYQNSIISRGIDVEFYTRLFVHTTSFASPYWSAVAEVAEDEGDEELATRAYGILDAITMDETTNSVLRISPVRRDQKVVTQTELFEDKIPKVVFINEEELWKVKPGVLESVNMVTTSFDILQDNLGEILDQTGSMHLKGDDLIVVNLSGVTEETPAKERAQAIISRLALAPVDTKWKSEYSQAFLETAEKTIIGRIEHDIKRKRKSHTEGLIKDLSRQNKSHTVDLLQNVVSDMVRRGRLREHRSGKISWLEVRPVVHEEDPFEIFSKFEAIKGPSLEDVGK
jgi:hypothetical protein